MPSYSSGQRGRSAKPLHYASWVRIPHSAQYGNASGDGEPGHRKGGANKAKDRREFYDIERNDIIINCKKSF